MQLSLQLTADGSGLVGTLRTSSGELKKFSTAAAQVEQQATGSFARSAVSLGAFASIGAEVVGVLGEIARAFPELIARQIEYMAEIGDVSDRLDVSAESLSALASRARIAGVDFGGLTGALDTFAGHAQKAAGGSRENAAAFDAMKISVRDTAGHLKSTDTLLAEAATKLSGYRDGAAKSAIATQLFGSHAGELLPVLNELGTIGIQGVIDKAREMGVVVDTEAVVAAQQLQTQMRVLRERVQGLVTDVATDLLPVLNSLAELMDSGADDASDLDDQSGKLAATLKILAGAGVIIKNVVDGLGLSLVAVAKVSMGVESALVSVFTAPYRAAAALATGGVDAAKAEIAETAATFGELRTTLGDAKAVLTQGWGDAWNDITQGLDKINNAGNGAAAGVGALGDAAEDAGGKPDAPVPQLAGAIDRVGKSARGLDPALADAARRAREAASALDQLRGIGEAVEESNEDLIARIAGADDAQIRYNRTLRDAEKAFQRATANGGNYLSALAQLARATQEAARELALTRAFDALQEFTPEKGPIFHIVDQIDTLKATLADLPELMGDAFDPEVAKKFQQAIDAANTALAIEMIGSYKSLLGAAQTFTREGSDGFRAMQAGMAALSIVQDALALKAAVTAVLTQGQGDPYSAWARMAAMAAAVAPYLASIGQTLSSFGGGGGFGDVAADRQAAQGTGTVLGDAAAKSESIANAVEITADASQQLVGINRGMLDALRAIQTGIGAASGQLARDAGSADFSGSNPLVLDSTNGAAIGAALGTAILPGIGTLVGAVLGYVVGGLLGGSSEITDQGLAISGGPVNDLDVQAYQETSYRTWRFGSTHTDTAMADVSEEFQRQFDLVIASIVDTVREGALALGLLPDEVEAAIAAYRVAEIQISLKDLTAEEQQAELEAVFSQIFDGLAGAVVPWIDQFQMVGEGLGETLVRVATEVMVAQEAFSQLGLSVDESDPERFAQIADSLVQAAGGLDAFIEGMQNFVSEFAGEGHQLEVAGRALTSAFDQAGLVLPRTREGMWALMQTLDATTEEGRAQIATLLRLADASAAYYDMLDEQVQKMADYTRLVVDLAAEAGGVGSITAFQAARFEIAAWERQTIAQANELARAAGLQGASEQDLALIHTIAARRVAQAIEILREETQSLISQLYGGGAANDAAYDLGDTMVDQFARIGAAADDLYQRQLAGIQSINDYLVSMQFGDLSGLSPEEQLAAAREQLLATQAAALGGDADAMQALPQMAQTFLQLLREQQASGGDYNAGYDWVRDLLQAVVTQGPTARPGASGAGGTPITQEYLDGRDARIVAQDEVQRAILAQQLTQHLGDLAEALNTPVLELAASMGVPLAQLATDLGINLQEITSASVTALANMATQLGIPLGELVAGLDLQLPDLADGIREMTDSLGIDLTALTSETAAQLASLGADLGVNLRDLSESLGIDLGKLTDVNSPIFQALSDTVGEIGGDTSTELQPYLDAIASAAGDEEANAAVKALRDHVDALAPDIRDALAPYFDDIIPTGPSDQLEYLQTMAGDTTSMAATLEDARDYLSAISQALRDANGANDVPGYAVGTGYVPATGLAMIHEGEAIIPAPFAAWLRTNGLPVAGNGGAANDGATAAEVRALRSEVVELRRVLADRIDHNTNAARDEHAKDRIQQEDIARRAPQSLDRRFG